MNIHTRLSTWLVVASLVLTTFTALPTTASLWAHAINLAILIGLVFVARYEGRHP